MHNYQILICRKNLSFLKSVNITILKHDECKKIGKLANSKKQLLILRSDQIRDHYGKEINDLIKINYASFLKSFNYSIKWSNYTYNEQINIYELMHGQK
tara:strand:+ start:208 stop:504 length:297 start_codon:yes stop_codon:yes gene_type:complete